MIDGMLANITSSRSIVYTRSKQITVCSSLLRYL